MGIVTPSRCWFERLTPPPFATGTLIVVASIIQLSRLPRSVSLSTSVSSPTPIGSRGTLCKHPYRQCSTARRSVRVRGWLPGKGTRHALRFLSPHDVGGSYGWWDGATAKRWRLREMDGIWLGAVPLAGDLTEGHPPKLKLV